jgi:hypothetical protein
MMVELIMSLVMEFSRAEFSIMEFSITEFSISSRRASVAVRLRLVLGFVAGSLSIGPTVWKQEERDDKLDVWIGNNININALNLEGATYSSGSGGS